MPDRDTLLASNILLVDDERANLAVLSMVLNTGGFHSVTGLTDPEHALAYCRRSAPDLVLLDLLMPNTDGYEVLVRMRSEMDENDPIPIVVVTADHSSEAKRKALALGATEFLVKPADATEVLIRVRNLLELRHLQGEMRKINEDLEAKISERTRELAQAELDSLELLARAAEFRDDATERHTRRVGELASRVAEHLGHPDAEPSVVGLAAPLHDIGKIGLPDSILLKKGPLSTDEFQQMKDHTTIGGAIIGDSRSSVLSMARSIALTHHERYDGAGYPHGLAGQEIPLPGRIVAVADVFDALGHARPYKDAWPREKALAYVRDNAGSQFDPTVVEAFLAAEPQIGVG